MADSTRLRILKNLQSTVQGITTGGGYNYTVPPTSVVLDPTVNILTVNGDLPYVIIEATPDGGITYYPAEQKREVFKVNLVARVDADASDPLSRATAWEKLAADFERALTRDHTRGGNAVDTRLGTPAPFVGVGSSVVVVVVPVEVRFHRTYGEPYA